MGRLGSQVERKQVGSSEHTGLMMITTVMSEESGGEGSTILKRAILLAGYQCSAQVCLLARVFELACRKGFLVHVYSVVIAGIV